MTRDEIMEMEAGREIDALVAEKVMQWKKEESISGVVWVDQSGDVVGYHYFSPSTNIADAWKVVDELEGRYDERTPWITVGKRFQHDNFRCTVGFDDWSYTARAETAPLAICRAALLAVMEE